MLVAHSIEALMEQKGLDAAKLARASGLNPTGVYDIINGKSRSPKIETIAKIATGLGVPVALLFSEHPSAGPTEELLVLYDSLPQDLRELLVQTARSWSPGTAA